MKRLCIALFMCCSLPLMAQTAANAAPDPWKALSFLEGTWDAIAHGNPA